jgi:uncharacterized membrane protein
MILLVLVLILTVPFFAVTLADRVIPGFRVSAATRGRVGLSFLFLFTGVGHYIRTLGMAQMVPPFLPYPEETIYITGVFELIGAIGLWIPVMRRLVGIALILMLIGFLPINFYAAFNYVDFGGHGIGPIYLLVRVPYQVLLIWWTYNATGQHWFDKLPATVTAKNLGNIKETILTFLFGFSAWVLFHFRSFTPTSPRPRG